MRKIFLLFILLLSITFVRAQILIDNGPLKDPNAIVPLYELSESKWNKTNLTYYINNTSAHLTAAQRENCIKRAFNEWDAVSSLSFTQVFNESSADFKIKWATGSHGDPHPFDGKGNVLAHAYYPYPDGGSYAGQIHFDDAEDWTETKLYLVALHEIGHALGIEHSPDGNAIMYEFYSPSRDGLSADDVAAITNLYDYAPLSGPNRINTTGTFSFSPLPSGAFTVETTPNLTLKLVSGNKITVEKKYNGSSCINVLMDGAIFARKLFWTGAPIISAITYNGSQLTAETFGLDAGITKTEWTIDGISYNTSSATLSFSVNWGIRTVTVKAYNDCGWSNTYTTQIDFWESTNNINVDINDRTVIVSIEENNKGINTQKFNNIDYMLVNLNSGIISKNGALSISGGTLNFYDVPDGLYILKLNIGNKNIKTVKLLFK